MSRLSREVGDKCPECPGCPVFIRSRNEWHNASRSILPSRDPVACKVNYQNDDSTMIINEGNTMTAITPDILDRTHEELDRHETRSTLACIEDVLPPEPHQAIQATDSRPSILEPLDVDRSLLGEH